LTQLVYALLAIDNNLKESIIVVVVIVAIKRNNDEQSFFFFFFFTLLKMPFIKKDVRQLLNVIKDIKLVELTKQQLKVIQVCHEVLAI